MPMDMPGSEKLANLCEGSGSFGQLPDKAAGQDSEAVMVALPFEVQAEHTFLVHGMQWYVLDESPRIGV